MEPPDGLFVQLVIIIKRATSKCTVGTECQTRDVSDVLINNIKYAMIAQMQNLTPGFEDVIKTHFYLKRDRLLQVRTNPVVYRRFSTI